MSRPVELVVIGGSAGSLEALQRILAGLPDGFGPATAIVIHLPPDTTNLLGEIFAGSVRLPIKLAEDKEPIAGGTIYLATPDYHLLVEKSRTFALSQDERVHYSRPAIDVLFESAAEAYGDRLMGVILSGANTDGAAGLRAVAEVGGIALVQSLESAEMIAMPAAALAAAPASIEVDINGLAERIRDHAESRELNDGR